MPKSKKIKDFGSPLEMGINILEAMTPTSEMAVNRERSRKNALNDSFDNITVDTCVGFDTGIWETGIERDGEPWVIVSQYDNTEEATKEHNEWVKALKKKRNMKLKSIQ